MSEGYGRHRMMDRTLDEIAAEMNSSGLTLGSGSVPFGRDYAERDYIGAPIRGVSNSSRRHTPYSRPSYHDRGRGRQSREGSMEGDELADNRIFVANLSFGTTWQVLKDHMRKAGPILKCDVFRDSGGSSKGMGLVIYEDMKSAESAVRLLTNTELEGRKIYVRKDMRHKDREKTGTSSYTGRGKPMANPSATVFVGNLDYCVTWQKLKDIFKVAGRVINADIIMDRDEKSKGMGEVQFEEPTDSISAIALFHGQMLFDRPMMVRMDSRAPFQPDPLQLKLSSLGAAPAMGGVALADVPSFMGRQPPQRGEVIYEPKVHIPSTHYTSRESHSEPYPRRSATFFELPRHAEYRDPPRRAYSPPQQRGADHSIFPSNIVDSDVFRNGAGSGSGGGHAFRARDRRGVQDRSSDRRFGGGSSEPNRKLFVKNGPTQQERPSSLLPCSARSKPNTHHSFPSLQLSYSTAWQNLKDTFRAAGSVQHVDILTGPDGRSKGSAVVWFDTCEGARKAIDMFNDCEVDGRKLEVRYDRMI